MKKVLAVFATVIACASLLTGCLVPERFSAKVDVDPNASYTFSYTGTTLNAFAAMQLKETGSLSKNDQINLKADAVKMSKEPDIRSAIYKGDGRYELEIESKKKAGQPLETLGIFSVRTDKKGIMTISTTVIDGKNKRDFEKLGITINGTLDVRLPKNAEVITHNATSTPTFGMFGSYSWKIGRIDQNPVLKVRFKS